MVAGCNSLFNDRTEIGTIVTRNSTDTVRTIEFRLSIDGDVVHEAVHELEPADGRTMTEEIADCEWPRTGERIEIAARIDAETWTRVDVSDEVGEGCVGISISTPKGWHDGDVEFAFYDCEKYVEDALCTTDSAE